MKYKNIFLLFSFVMLSSCSHDNETGISQLSADEVRLSCEVATSRAATGVQGNSLDPSTILGVFVTQPVNNTTFYGYANKYYTNDGVGNLEPLSPTYFPLSNDDVDLEFIAYAPWHTTYSILNQPHNFAVQTDQSTSEGYIKSDLMYGIPKNGNPVHHVISHDPANKTQNVVLSIRHLLSKITLTLEPPSTLTADGLVGARVKLKQVGTQVKFTIADGSLGEVTVPADVLIGEISSATDLTVSGLIPPQTVVSGSAFFEVTLANGDVYEYAIPSTTTLTLGGGRNYHFKMKLKSANKTEVTMTIVDWVDVEGEYIL
ncbi:MAG: fimbrillin family protein [Prevotella sp.]|nr:fimbrillin family protein [Prevotella sp.]